jgi:2-polyprenyl-6-hydroxyphenyl methylase/3-demethylubiquinone-9 3-methyltransferase
MTMGEPTSPPAATVPANVDTTSHSEFFDYYAKQSETEETRRRFRGLRDAVREARRLCDRETPMTRSVWSVADIGCGAGTQSMMWAQEGHEVHGLDINAPLVELAAKRAGAYGLAIDLRVGSAAALPWPDCSIDVCLVPELLEHVPEWERCLDEFARVLRPNGLLAITTNNTLCPIQYEFNLPLYSWYPSRLKRRYERLAVTTRPDIANYAKYPAVNWFTYYGLSRALRRRDMRTLDRFDVAAPGTASMIKRALLTLIRSVPPLRALGHVATPYTLVIGVKSPR